MSNATHLKKENIRKVIQVLRNNDRITKPEIAQLTGLTGATVHGVISGLEAQGLIKKSGLSLSKGGRKAQFYKINETYRYVAGISIRTHKIIIGVYNFNLGPICSNQYDHNLGEHTVEETIHDIDTYFNELLSQNKIDKDSISTVGINVPGPVDYDRGRIISLRGYPKWHNIDFSDQFQALTGLPAYVDKDVNSGVLLIKQLKKLENHVNTVYISAEGGIGAGLIINGQIYRGNHGVAGEIGHITMQEDGERCGCGNIGCLELLSSDHAIIQRCIKGGIVPEHKKFTIEDAIRLYKEGNEQVGDIFTSATRYLATAIRNCFMAYDPDEIFIRCTWLDLNKQLFFQLVDELYDNNTLIDRGDIKISLINEDNFVVKSAAAIALNHELESLDSNVFSAENV